MSAQPFGKRKTAPPVSGSSKFLAKPAPAARPVLVTASSSPERNASPAAINQQTASPSAVGRKERAQSASRAFLFGSLLPELQEDKYEDLAKFFGPNADKFLNIYQNMLAKRRIKINWAAFFLEFVWFFYRKMYLVGALFVVLPIVVGYLIPIGGIATSVVAGNLGNTLYIRDAIRRIKRADELQLTGEERIKYLKRTGGVSITAGAIAALFYVGIIVLVVLSRAHGSK